MNTKLMQIISGVGIFFSIYLVAMEVIEKDYCPRFMKIPACYLVLIAFILVFFSTFRVAYSETCFIIGVSIGLILAVWFSVNHLFVKKMCPVLFRVPLCYVSLITFISLIYIHSKK